MGSLRYTVWNYNTLHCFMTKNCHKGSFFGRIVPGYKLEIERLLLNECILKKPIKW